MKDNADDYPPRIHGPARLLASTTVVLTPDQKVLLAELNRFQMEGRYPDYQRAVAQQATEAYTRNIPPSYADGYSVSCPNPRKVIFAGTASVRHPFAQGCFIRVFCAQ